MTKSILVVGTASHVGKSTVVAGLCRLLSDRGVDVAPFKAQNMSNNAQVALTPGGDWGEIGVSQYVQAQAARITPTTDMNPVLLKPRGEGESQVVIHGAALGHYRSEEYFASGWEHARRAARDSYERLAADYDVIVAEGAGGAAEINLRHRDLANRETAEFTDSAVIVVADIDRGGAFSSLYGTIKLAPSAIRERIVGAIITKFRGGSDLLAPGLQEFEALTDVPVLGVIPHDDPGLPAEDSVSVPPSEGRTVMGAEDGVPSERSVTIVVPRLPRISNFTDFEPLVREPGVRVHYTPLTVDLADADAVILPGTKNTVDDLHALRQAGFDRALDRFEGPVLGICGGFQMLGERITGAAIEGTGDGDVVDGFGLLPVETEFSPRKSVKRVTVDAAGGGILAGLAGTVAGYEIHMGESSPLRPVCTPLEDGSVAAGDVLGTYLHGVFENPNVRRAYLTDVFRRVDRPMPEHGADDDSPFDRSAALVAAHLDLTSLLDRG